MSEVVFRLVLTFVFIGMFLLSGYFRRRARRSGEVIPRAREGTAVLIARMAVAAPLYLSFAAYAINPRWMAWSSFVAPTWLRWTAAAASICMLPLLVWVLASIGKNISETMLTKHEHELVTHGPYRWVRHPLYGVALGMLLSLGALAANWFMLATALIAGAGILLFVIPKEEAELVRKFGNEYREYQSRTGRLLPRLFVRP